MMLSLRNTLGHAVEILSFLILPQQGMAASSTELRDCCVIPVTDLPYKSTARIPHFLPHTQPLRRLNHFLMWNTPL